MFISVLWLCYLSSRFICSVCREVREALRAFLCKRIFKKCGKIGTINRRVNFGSGRNIEMGDDAG